GHNAANNIKTTRHAPPRRDHRLFFLPAVPAATHHRQTNPAVVRRHGGGMDDVPGVFPDSAAARLFLRALADAASQTENPTHRAWRAAPVRHRVVAYHSRCGMETGRRRIALLAHSPLARSDGGLALLPAVHHQPADSGVVLAAISGDEPVSPVRAVQPR